MSTLRNQEDRWMMFSAPWRAATQVFRGIGNKRRHQHPYIQ
ncbi:hypothetical protein A2U01_0066672, partial [Trifolium medium]|nr:hypothetical protein [Trifolium medium]